MRNHWQRTTQTLGGYPCVRHKITKELTIAGKRGEIWLYSPGMYRAVLKPGKWKFALTTLLKVGGPIETDSEALITFPESDLPLVIKAIKAPKFSGHQVKYANSF